MVTKPADRPWLAAYRAEREELADRLAAVEDTYQARLVGLLAAARKMPLGDLEDLIRAMPAGYWRSELRAIWRVRTNRGGA